MTAALPPDGQLAVDAYLAVGMLADHFLERVDCDDRAFLRFAVGFARSPRVHRILRLGGRHHVAAAARIAVYDLARARGLHPSPDGLSAGCELLVDLAAEKGAAT